MENANPFIPIPLNGLHARITQELNELWEISAMIDSRLENIGRTHIPTPPAVPFEQLLDDFVNPPDELVMDDLESDTESYKTPLVSPFLDSGDESNEGEVINELNEYGNAVNFYRRKAHLLKDKQIPSVGVFDEVIWEALGRNTHDLDLIWKETGQDYYFTRSGFKNARTMPGDDVAIPSDAVGTYKRRRHKLCDDVRM
ncbi:hypothetical protein Tco_1354197 [Tanacetum coccineum]